MTASSARTPPAPAPAAPDGVVPEPLSRTRVEVTIARSAAGFGGVFFLLSLLSLSDQAANLHPLWVGLVVPGLGLGLVLLGIATFTRWRKSFAAMVFAGGYVLALLSWPLAVLDPAAAPQGSFWLYQLLTVATVFAVIAFPLDWATIYLIGVPLLYGVIRITLPGGGVPLDQAALDSIYAIVLGGFVTIVSTVLRDAARAVDQARATALERYTAAVRHHATDAERVEVDSLVHDSVLTTLLSAARASTPEAKALVAQMAEAAVQRLREAVALAPEAEAHVSAAALAARIRASAATLVPPVPVSVARLQQLPIPRHAAEALHSAAVQAMLNSVQHAGPQAQRWLRVEGRPDDGGIAIEVGDTGRGFVLEEVPTERIGVRVSIVERTAAAGGRAELRSAPGEGTRVLLCWPDPDAHPVPDFEEFEAEREEGLP